MAVPEEHERLSGEKGCPSCGLIRNGEALEQVLTELEYTERKFPPFHSAHEGLAVLEEEVHELRMAVYEQYGLWRTKHMYKEVKQVAAMALRFMKDIHNGSIQHSLNDTPEELT